MKASEIYRHAGDLIRVFGWAQGDLGYGESPRCALGSCGVVASYYVPHLQIAAGTEFIALWNDEADRTAAEVMIALDAAYVLALQEEGDDPADCEVL